MKKTYIVIGLGRFGSAVAQRLYELGSEVLAIDLHPELVQKMESKVTCAAVCDTRDEDALRALGVTDVFDAGKADFSPLTDKADAIFLSHAKHSARVTIDEEGVVAAAYTVMVACGAALPPDERVEFTLDRPFLFAVTGESGEILFAGIVNTPA